MIEINLLPEELRVRSKSAAEGVEPKKFIYLIPVFFGLLFFVQILLAGVVLARNIHFAMLNRKWQTLTPQRKEAEDFQRAYTTLSANAKVAKQMLNKRINWAEKLNKLSLYLPMGVWFNEISVDSSVFTLKGSIISLEKDEMAMLSQFINSLKNDKGFSRDFKSLELSSVQRRMLGSFDILDFILSGAFRSK